MIENSRSNDSEKAAKANVYLELCQAFTRLSGIVWEWETILLF